MTDVETGIGLEGIRPELHSDAVPIEDVTPYPGNARRGDHDKIRASLSKHGQYKSLPVQASTGYVLMGNNTYAVMREMGYTVVAVSRLDVDDDRAREMLLVDNRSSDDAIYDDTALASLLAGVVDWDATGYDPDELDDLLETLKEQGDPEALAAAIPAGIAPTVMETVPATDARYAETDEQEALRQARFDGSAPRYAKAMTEVILVFPEETRTAVLELIAKARPVLGLSRNGDVVHGALLLLGEVLDASRRGDLMVDVATALKVAVPDSGDPGGADTPAPPAESDGDGPDGGSVEPGEG